MKTEEETVEYITYKSPSMDIDIIGSEPTHYIPTSILKQHEAERRYDDAMNRMNRMYNKMETAASYSTAPTTPIKPGGVVGSKSNPFDIVTTVNGVKPVTGAGVYSRGILNVHHYNGTGIKYDLDDKTASFIKEDGIKHELSEILELGYKALKKKEKPFDAKEAAKTTKLNFNGVPIYRTFNTENYEWIYKLFENTKDVITIYISGGTPAEEHVKIIKKAIQDALSNFVDGDINITKLA